MKIKLYWPQCNYINGEWTKDKRIDSYWLECTYEEAVHSILPFLSETQKLDFHKIDHQGNDNKITEMESHSFCFLISQDLQSIVPMPWFYPYSGQWNAYCPFKEIKEIEISNLKEIENIRSESL